MNAQKIASPAPGPLDISPALETGSPTPLSTHWIPLHELIEHWTEVDSLLAPAPLGPVLSAIGHGLLALAAETSALERVTRAWEHREHAWRGALLGLEQAMRCLERAAREWGTAAGCLDSLAPTDLEQEAYARARRLAEVARSQQARLWRLTNEVRADAEAWRNEHQRAPRPTEEKAVG